MGTVDYIRHPQGESQRRRELEPIDGEQIGETFFRASGPHQTERAQVGSFPEPARHTAASADGRLYSRCLGARSFIQKSYDQRQLKLRSYCLVENVTERPVKRESSSRRRGCGKVGNSKNFPRSRSDRLFHRPRRPQMLKAGRTPIQFEPLAIDSLQNLTPPFAHAPLLKLKQQRL